MNIAMLTLAIGENYYDHYERVKRATAQRDYQEIHYIKYYCKNKKNMKSTLKNGKKTKGPFTGTDSPPPPPKKKKKKRKETKNKQTNKQTKNEQANCIN